MVRTVYGYVITKFFGMGRFTEPGDSAHARASHAPRAPLLSGYWAKQQKTSLITVEEVNPIGSQPPQRLPIGVWYNNFSSADIHGMNANMAQISNQQNSIEIKQSGHG